MSPKTDRPESSPRVERATNGRGASYELIYVPNSLAEKAGAFRADRAPLDAIDSSLATLAQSYPKTAAQDLERLAALWSRLKQGAADESAETAVFRIAHDFKGQGATLGYPLVSAVADSLCVLIRSGCLAEPRAHAAVDAHVEALTAVLQKRITGDGSDVGKRLVDGVRAIVLKFAKRESD